jgi:L-iditol 2-dehydrogenase
MFDVPIPEIVNDTDVLIRVTNVGVCGSDIHYYNTGQIGNQIVKFPFTIGHEGAGIVKEVGKSVSRVKPGDRVALDPAMPCFQCEQCKIGRFHTCNKLLFLGCPGQAEGCLSEYVIMPEKSCFPISDKLSLEDASLSEPMTVGLYAVKLSQIKPNIKIGIIGCGPIGLSVLNAAQIYHPKKIYVTDKLDYRLNAALKLNASWTGNPTRQDIVKDIAKEEPLLLDMIFECCGKQEAINQAMELLRPGGKLIIVGIPEFENFSFPAHLMRRKEICIQNVRRQNETLQECLDLMERNELKKDFLITHRFKLSETKKAFELVSGYDDGVIKAMIEI